jgi:ribosomal protein S13
MLSDEEIARIRDIIERNYKVEGDLRKDVASTSRGLWILAANGDWT